jgi:uncharacterized RDD family membrane protein YckC
MTTPDGEPDDRVPHPGPHHHCENATALQRVAGWCLDVIVIVAWIGAIAGVRIFAFGDASPPDADVASKLVGHGIGLATLTIPVWLYLSLPEWRWGYSLGKAALGLRVIDLTGHYPTLPRALLRNAILLAPWETAHAAIWWSPGRPFVDAPGQIATIALLGSNALMLIWLLSTLILPGRSIHDLIGGTKVIQVGVLKPAPA